MNKSKNRKIVEITAFVLIIIVFIKIIINIFSLYSDNKELNQMNDNNKFIVLVSNFLHKVQEERAAASGFIGSGSDNFMTLYLVKINETNKIVKKLLFIKNSYFSNYINNIRINFNNLKKIRKQILNNQVNLKNEIRFYNNFNDNLLELFTKIIPIYKNSKILRNFISYRDFEIAKERVSRERAILSGILSQNRWNKILYVLYVNILSEKKVLFKMAIDLNSNQDIKNKFLELKNSKLFEKIENIENITLEKGNNFNINSLFFYSLINKEMEKLEKISNEMMEINFKLLKQEKYRLWTKFIYQSLMDLLLVIFLFYTLFLFHKENRELFEKSSTDKLTKLYNREFFINSFEHMKARVDRNNSKLGIMFIDLDGFKGINDKYGHEAGDKVLLEVSSRLKKILRKSDIIARFGGDEFVIMLENIDNNTIKIVAEKIITEISKPIFVKKNIMANVGTSIGISIYPDDADNITDLIKKADEAMYFSKKSGKGIFTFYN